MGRTLVGRDLDNLGDLPVPDHVEDLLGLRVADLDDSARRVLLALALDADLRVAQLPQPAGIAALQAALDAGVVVVEGDRVRPHTLCSPLRPRSRRPTRRSARCTAGSPTWSPTSSDAPSTSPWPPRADEALARVIDAAAAAAAARGATRLAIDLAAHAWRLTPPDVSDVDRVLALGLHLHDAGEKQRLTELLGDRVESLPPARRA